jgi:hypothetical protein
MLNRNNLFVHNTNLSGGQYIRIACETDEQGNPIQYSMACDFIDQIYPDTSEIYSITGGYWLTKDTIRWYVSHYTGVATFSGQALSTVPCIIAIYKLYSHDKAYEVSNKLSGLYVSGDADVVALISTLAGNTSLDFTQSITQSEFNGFTKFVNASVGSPSVFNNFWSLT